MNSKLPLLSILCFLPLLALSRSAADGVYAKPQAARGQALYLEECAKCHGQNLSGGDGSPELSGAEFLTRWKGKSVGALFTLISQTMPTDDPGHLSTRQAADLVAFLLSSNNFPAGEKDLENTPETLGAIQIP